MNKKQEEIYRLAAHTQPLLYETLECSGCSDETCVGAGEGRYLETAAKAYEAGWREVQGELLCRKCIAGLKHRAKIREQATIALIAAAPNLLTALKGTVGMLERIALGDPCPYDDYRAMMERVRAIIAEAEGNE